MSPAVWLVAVGTVYLGFCGGMVSGQAPPVDPGHEQAERWFREGQFVEAERAYAAFLAQRPEDFDARVRLGEIALLSNRLDEAERHLRDAVARRPQEPRPSRPLAELFYRRDDFAHAAELYRATGRTALADKLTSFGSARPYRIRDALATVRVRFLQTDPLPLIAARVNDSEEVYFLVDTGGGELILDPSLAEQIGAPRFGAESGVFGGDQRAHTEHSRVDMVRLGELEVRDVPVHLLDTSRFAVVGGGRRVSGILGTVFLYHFRATLDYPAGELVLEPRGSAPTQPVEPTGSPVVRVPFWLAGDHFILAHGAVNRQSPCLMFVDTGLAGGAFTCPQSMIEAAQIKLPDVTFEAQGGGGPLKVTPFRLDELSLGEATRTNLNGFFGPFPASLEHAFGFRIGGLISHAFFRPYRVTFDFGRMEILLARAAPSDQPPAKPQSRP